MDLNLLEALKNVDKSNPDSWVSMAPFYKELDIPDYYSSEIQEELNARVGMYYLIKYYDTDTWVGVQAVYLDDELVAATYQQGRKSGISVEFVSYEAAKKVYELLTPRFNPTRFNYVNPDEKIEDTFSVHYASQVLVDKGYHGDRPVERMRWKREDNRPHYCDDSIQVRYEDGEVAVIPVQDYEMPVACTTNPKFKAEENDD